MWFISSIGRQLRGAKERLGCLEGRQAPAVALLWGEPQRAAIGAQISSLGLPVDGGEALIEVHDVPLN